MARLVEAVCWWCSLGCLLALLLVDDRSEENDLKWWLSGWIELGFCKSSTLWIDCSDAFLSCGGKI